MTSATQRIITFFFALAATGLLSLASATGVAWTLRTLTPRSTLEIGLLVLVVIVLGNLLMRGVLFLAKSDLSRATFAGAALPDDLLLILGILCVVFAIPALIIFWFFHPEKYGWAIRIGAFLASSGVAVLYYLKNPQRFPSPADKVTFFSGVCLGPPTALWLLLGA